MRFSVVYRGDIVGTATLSAEGPGEPATGQLEVTEHYAKHRAAFRTPLPADSPGMPVNGDVYGAGLLQHALQLATSGLVLHDQEGRLVPAGLILISDLLPREADPARFPGMIHVAVIDAQLP